jgi:hypothetical protein
MTKDDVLNGNVDLLARAGQELSAMPVRKLRVTATQSGANLTVQLQVSNLDRADIYVDGRPRGSMNISSASASFAVTGVPGASTVRVEGYSVGVLVAARTVAV